VFVMHHLRLLRRISVAPAVWNGMSVAVKIIARDKITQQQRLSILNEVANLQTLMHPNCVRVMGATEQPALHVSLVTEWLHGGSLAEHLRLNPSATEQHRVALFNHVCSAGAARPHHSSPLLYVHFHVSVSSHFLHQLLTSILALPPPSATD
jgi:serine/threonine protein kinase